jgi:uncharacterized protein with HEPN domain
MSKHLPKVKVIDMLQSIERIIEYTAGMTFENFVADGKTRDAVIWNIQVLGEAANGIPKEFREAHDEIEWTKIIRSRNIIAHQYDAIDYSIIWRIVTIHSPSLKKALEEILKSI